MTTPWSGLCPRGTHGLDFEGQDCDLCHRELGTLVSLPYFKQFFKLQRAGLWMRTIPRGTAYVVRRSTGWWTWLLIKETNELVEASVVLPLHERTLFATKNQAIDAVYAYLTKDDQ